MIDLKNNKLLLNYSITGVILVSIVGTVAHFIYDWTGQNPIIGLITAVNESTWEHMKLLFFPMVLVWRLLDLLGLDMDGQRFIMRMESTGVPP